MVGQPAQLAQATSQTMWCADVERALAAPDRPAALAGVKRGCVAQLAELAAMVRADLAPIARLSVASLITLSVHGRDVTTALLRCAPAVILKHPGNSTGCISSWLACYQNSGAAVYMHILSKLVLQ